MNIYVDHYLFVAALYAAKVGALGFCPLGPAINNLQRVARGSEELGRSL